MRMRTSSVRTRVALKVHTNTKLLHCSDRLSMLSGVLSNYHLTPLMAAAYSKQFSNYKSILDETTETSKVEWVDSQLDLFLENLRDVELEIHPHLNVGFLAVLAPLIVPVIIPLVTSVIPLALPFVSPLIQKCVDFFIKRGGDNGNGLAQSFLSVVGGTKEGHVVMNEAERYSAIIRHFLPPGTTVVTEAAKNEANNMIINTMNSRGVDYNTAMTICISTVEDLKRITVVGAPITMAGGQTTDQNFNNRQMQQAPLIQQPQFNQPQYQQPQYQQTQQFQLQS